MLSGNLWGGYLGTKRYTRYQALRLSHLNVHMFLGYAKPLQSPKNFEDMDFLKKIVVKLIASWTQLKCFADVQQMEKSLNSRAERDFRVICLRAVPEDLVYKMGVWSPMLQGLC